MDGKGAWRDNVFVERLWRSVKYEEVYLRAYDTVSEARTSIGRYLDLYEDGAVKGIFRWCLAILIAPGYGFRRTVKPRSREAVRRRRRA